MRGGRARARPARGRARAGTRIRTSPIVSGLASCSRASRPSRRARVPLPHARATVPEGNEAVVCAVSAQLASAVVYTRFSHFEKCRGAVAIRSERFPPKAKPVCDFGGDGPFCRRPLIISFPRRICEMTFRYSHGLRKKHAPALLSPALPSRRPPLPPFRRSVSRRCSFPRSLAFPTPRTWCTRCAWPPCKSSTAPPPARASPRRTWR